MTGKLPLVYWDSCVFLAHLTGEDCDPASVSGMVEWAQRVDSGAGIIMTSAITMVEVLEARLSADVKRRYETLFQSPYMQLLDCDDRICRRASELRSFYSKPKAKTLSTPDAIHLATALLYKAGEFHTFDGANGKQRKKKTLLLLPLDGNVAGHKLKICTPSADQMRIVA